MPHRARPARLTGWLAPSLVLVLGVAACASTVPSVAPAPSAASSTTVTAGSPTPTTTPGPASSEPAEAAWHLVELPDSGDVAMISDVLASEGRVIADAAAGPAGERGVAWVSTDRGATWVSEPVPGSGAAGRMLAWGDRVLSISVGEGSGECAHPATVEIRMRDAAGTWAAAPPDELFCAGGLPGAAASGQHAVVVGMGTGDQAFAWSSEDGLHWTDRSEVFANRLPAGVVFDGSGFIAFGTGLPPAPAWTTRSGDGATWQTPEPLSGLPQTSIMANPVIVGSGAAVFIADASGAVGILRPDGQGGWHSEPCTGISSATLVRVVTIENWLVALGGDEKGALAWISPDGVTWRPLDLPPEAVASGPNASLTGAAVADGRAYLTGQILAPAGDRTIGALWTGPGQLLHP